MYKMIHDEKELKWFFDNIMPPLRESESYFMSLSARSKYLTPEEKVELSLGRAEMFERRIVRKKDWTKFLSTVKKFETAEGSYITKTGANIPSKAIVLYFNINPSDSLKAYRKFSSTMGEYVFELGQVAINGRDAENVLYRMQKMNTLLMNSYQTETGTRHWLDFDYDVPKDFLPHIETTVKRIKNLGGKAYIIDTKSGYHLLVQKSKEIFSKEFNPHMIAMFGTIELREFLRDEKGLTTENELDEAMSKYEVIHNKNAMIPMIGTYQGGYKVRVLNK